MDEPSIHARIIETTPWPQRIIVFLALTILDLGFNAAAGAAAAKVGAQKNGFVDGSSSWSLADIIALGALAGTMKSGFLALPVAGRKFGGVSWTMHIVLFILFNPFGITTLIVALISQRVYDGAIPKELLIAGIVAAIPLSVEMVYPEALATTRLGTISLIGWDALAGYTFARMAQNQGFPICDLNAAAAAGAVYGCLSALKGLIYSVLATNNTHTTMNGRGSSTRVTSLLGQWDIYDPLPPANNGHWWV